MYCMPLTQVCFRSIPGKRREYLIYAGGIPLYKERLDEAAMGWQDFDVFKESS